MKRRLRQMLAAATPLVAVGLVAALAWVSHHPGHPLLARARSWPLVGPWVGRMQDGYARPPQQPASDPRTANADAPADAGSDRITSQPSIWVKPGMKLYHRPAVSAPITVRFAAYANLPHLETRNGWARVRWHDTIGWLEPAPDSGPPLGRAPEPPRPLPPRRADRARLAAACALLGTNAREQALGPYTLLTDSTNRLLITRLGRLAERLDRVYEERFGRAPRGTPRETVVLFEHEADYRQFQGLSPELSGRNAAGHAGWGIAALFRGRRDIENVSATFIHELVHLINRRALGPALPPWLGEGLAEALATARLLPWGDLEPRHWGGIRRQFGSRIELSGGRAARMRLRRALRTGALPSLASLLALDAGNFSRDAPNAEQRYAMAGTFIRYLLDGDDARWARAFQGFLDAVAQGDDARGEALRARLATRWDALDGGYRAWLLTTPP